MLSKSNAPEGLITEPNRRKKVGYNFFPETTDFWQNFVLFIFFNLFLKSAVGNGYTI